MDMKEEVKTKKSPDQRMGRPSSSPWRKRSPGRPVANPALVTSPKKIPSFTPEEMEYQSTHTPTSKPKSILPFWKTILPKKTEMVDVYAAFGSDSSFLPRPLTSPQPEEQRRLSAEETGRVLAELKTEGNAAEEPQPSSSITSVTSCLSDALLEKPFAPNNGDVENQPPTVTTEESRPFSLASLLSQGTLLSDVAGTRKAETRATLVKLDRPSPFQSVKCADVIKTFSSPPSRIETAEEIIEKQLAIQALNKSIGIESSSNLGKESGYSICYVKTDGSIVSRSVTRPSYPGLMSLGKGSVAPVLKYSFRV